MLFSWIGSADLNAMAEGLPDAEKDELFNDNGVKRFKVTGGGPVKTLLNSQEFEDVHLLCNQSSKIAQWYQKWLNLPVTMHYVNLDDPTDYSEIYKEINNLLEDRVSSDVEKLTFHLTPGTPAMAAIWVLIGKSSFPARLVQTTREGGVNDAHIPFDVRVDLIPQVLNAADNLWTRLASQSPQEISGFEQILGDSHAIRMAVGIAKRIAQRDVSTLIAGESGTGKELFARAIHQAGARKNEPFVALNCAALNSELLQSELFGHGEGAFTGAKTRRQGAFEQANGGTLFLDEIGECSPEMQATLLRVLQPPPGEKRSTRVFRKVGEDADTIVDVRVISATNRNLDEEVEQGNFREDLLYRLAVAKIRLPPLRDRDTDVGLITNAILKSINEEFAEVEPGYVALTLSADAHALLGRQTWSGNVRALSSCLMQAAILSDGPSITERDIAGVLPEVQSVESPPCLLGDGFSIISHVTEIKRRYLVKAVQESGGIKSKAARLLGLKSYQNLDNQLRKLGLTFETIWEER
jgi:DNA-binding NtrC family response regulator